MTTWRQTATDARHEEGMAHQLAAWLGFALHRLPMRSPVDWLGVQEETVTHVIEGKRRMHRLADHATVWVEASKVEALDALARGFRLDPGSCGLFAVQWHDAIGVVNVRRIRKAPLVRRRREDRDDPLDTDAVYDVPVVWFDLMR